MGRIAVASAAAQIGGDFSLDKFGARFRRRIGAAPEQAAACSPAEPRPPKRRRDRRIIAGIGQQVRGHLVRFDLDLAVEPPVLAELAEESLLDAGRLEPPSVLEYQM